MKILILAGYTRSLAIFRGNLIREVIAKGHEVHASASEPDEGGLLHDMGLIFHQLPMARRGTNPLADLRLKKSYEKLIREVGPDVLFCYTIKPNIYGAMAGRAAGVERIVTMVTGLGNVFVSEKGIRRKLVRLAVVALYRKAARDCSCMIFQNPDDRRRFVDMRIVREEKTRLVDGSGVDMQYYRPSPLPAEPVFLMVSRLLREKGVMEYLNAARIVKKEQPEARFLLVGPYEDSGFALTEEDLRPYIQEGCVEYLGETGDVRPYYAMASVVVLPSFREGTPRTVLEAMACGRAVITTDAPGCRETVQHEKTGLLVPVGDAPALAEAICRMIRSPERVKDMGGAGLAYCRERYEVGKVNKTMLAILGLQGDAQTVHPKPLR